MTWQGFTLRYLQKVNKFEIYERHSITNVKYLVVRTIPTKRRIFGQRFSFSLFPQNTQNRINIFLVDEKEQAIQLAKELSRAK